MIKDFAAGKHTANLWKEVAPILRDIEKLPFLEQLADGSLEALPFTNYILQDDFYLAGYARAMALLAAKTSVPSEARFWAQSVSTAIYAEEEMHASLLEDDELVAARAKLLEDKSYSASPTTLGYVSFLIATAATRSYAIGVAGVLPCFWVYAHAGKVLVQKAGNLPESHPYKAWIDMYDSKEFDEATVQAVQILEKWMDAATEKELQEMKEVFTQACIYELHFWGTAHKLQGWELP